MKQWRRRRKTRKTKAGKSEIGEEKRWIYCRKIPRNADRKATTKTRRDVDMLTEMDKEKCINWPKETKTPRDSVFKGRLQVFTHFKMLRCHIMMSIATKANICLKTIISTSGDVGLSLWRCHVKLDDSSHVTAKRLSSDSISLCEFQSICWSSGSVWVNRLKEDFDINEFVRGTYSNSGVFVFCLQR